MWREIKKLMEGRLNSLDPMCIGIIFWLIGVGEVCDDIVRLEGEAKEIAKAMSIEEVKLIDLLMLMREKGIVEWEEKEGVLRISLYLFSEGQVKRRESWRYNSKRRRTR